MAPCLFGATELLGEAGRLSEQRAWPEFTQRRRSRPYGPRGPGAGSGWTARRWHGESHQNSRSRRLNYWETPLSSSRHIALTLSPQFLFPISHLDCRQIGCVQPPRFTPRFHNQRPPVKEGTVCVICRHPPLCLQTLPRLPPPPPVSLPAQQQHGVITDKQSILH